MTEPSEGDPTLIVETTPVVGPPPDEGLPETDIDNDSEIDYDNLEGKPEEYAPGTTDDDLDEYVDDSEGEPDGEDEDPEGEDAE